MAEVRSVCILLSTSVRRNVPSKHQTLGGGAHLYHSAFQTGGCMFKWDTSTSWDPPPLIISRYFGLLLNSAEFYGSTKKTRMGVLVVFGGVKHIQENVFSLEL